MKYLRIFPFLILILMYYFCNSLIAGLGSGEKNNKPYNNRSRSSTVEYMPNIIVVKFSPEVKLAKKAAQTGLARIDRLVQKHRVYSMRRMIESDNHLKKSRYLKNVYFIEYSGDESPDLVAKDFSQVRNIVYAEVLRKYRLAATPNDAMYNVQEGYYKKIRAPEAWDEVKGEQGNVVIAIVDGGTLIGHPDLSANLWVNPGEIPNNGLDDDGNGLIDDIHGWNFANDSPDPTGLFATHENGDHGTHTAGIASAVSNNSKGVAGASWNAQIMAINAGCPDEDNCIVYGYWGIQYAAFNGADIINCSWGRLGDHSQLEEDVINEATAQGAVVVCAAGNDTSSAPEYPSSYRNAFSVAATTLDDTKAIFSNFGPTIDVAAPGISILSTVDSTNGTTASYNYSSGTSMSTPMVAGIIALVKTKYPSWTSMQAAEQVRVTADAINDDLGKGRINAYRALTESHPSIRISDIKYFDSGGDSIINAGETVDVYLTLINYLSPATNVGLSLTTEDPNITMQSDYMNLTAIDTWEEIPLSMPFSFYVAEDAPIGSNATFKLIINSVNYEDWDYLFLPIQAPFGNISINNIDATITNIGRIGYADPYNSQYGIGFKYENGPSLLFDGALILGTSENQISSASRGDISSDGDVPWDHDFDVVSNGVLKIFTPGASSDQESKGIFADTEADNPMNIHVTQETYALSDPGHEDFVVFKYKVQNLGGSTLNNFHFGLFFDWDIDAANYFSNIGDFEANRKMGYAYDTGSGPSTHVGVSVLSEGGISFRAFYNDPDDPNNPGWGIHDGFTDQEKWESISGGIDHGFLTAGPADISFVISQGPFSITPQATQAIGFAMIAAPDYEQLLVHADSAQSFWDRVVVLGIEEDNQERFPVKFAMGQNYPNPFNPGTKIKFDVERIEKIKIDIYNTLGQKVRTLFNDIKPPGRHEISWNGTNDLGNLVASGVYIYRMTAGEFVQTRKMLLLR